MGRDGLLRMDVDTRWLFNKRWRKLQRLHPDDWPHCVVAYFALLADAWYGRDREVSLEDSWPSSLRADLDVVKERLRSAGLIDVNGFIPIAAWDEWYGPAARRIDSARTAAAVRWQGDRNAYRPASQPSQPEKRAKRNDGPKTDPVDMKAALKASGFDVDQLPGGSDKGG